MRHRGILTAIFSAVILTSICPALAWEIPSSVKVELVRVVTEDKATLNGALFSPDPKVNPSPKRAILVTHGTGGSFYGGINSFLPPLLAEKGYLGLSLNRRDAGHAYYRSTFEDGIKDLKAGIDFLAAKEIGRAHV